MDKNTFSIIERHMLDQMRDSAHDKHHVYRVLYTALDIAQTLPGADMDVLLASCLLHDIGRQRQFEDPSLCHAQVGGEMAYGYLQSIGWPEHAAGQVRHCIGSHRYRESSQPQSIEAKILFDADKLDVTGALGIARTLFYKGQVGQPLYNLDEKGAVIERAEGSEPYSFFEEYQFKLKDIYDKFYTDRARRIALGRRQAAADYYESLLSEINASCRNAGQKLSGVLGPV